MLRPVEGLEEGDLLLVGVFSSVQDLLGVLSSGISNSPGVPVGHGLHPSLITWDTDVATP